MKAEKIVTLKVRVASRAPDAAHWSPDRWRKSLQGLVVGLQGPAASECQVNDVIVADLHEPAEAK